MFDWVIGALPWGRNSKNKLAEEYVTPIDNQSSTENGTVGTETALKLSVVWSCIKFRSQVFASLPVHVRNNENIIDKNHGLYKLLHRRPNAVQTAFTFRSVISRHIDLYGNGFAKIIRDTSGNPVSLEIIDPETVELSRGTYSIQYYIDDKAAQASDILHFMGMTLDGMLGLSPIVYHAEMMSTASAVNKAAQTGFKNGLKAGGFIYTGETTLTKDQRVKMRNVLGEFAKPENSGKWLIMEAGMKPEPISADNTTPRDAQMLEHRIQLVIEMCSIFGVNPSLIGYNFSGNTWGGTLEQLNLQFLQHELGPMLANIEQELEFKLLKPVEQGQFSIKHSIEGLLRADSKTRNEIMVNQVNNGLRTLDEVRGLDDMAPYPDGIGSTPVRQVQYQPLDALLNQTQGGTDEAE